jgi:hypothetical protein
MDSISRFLYTTLNIISLLAALVGIIMLALFGAFLFKEGPAWEVALRGMSFLVVALLLRILWDIGVRLARIERRLGERASGEE